MDPLPLGRCIDKNSIKQCHRWANLICSHCNQAVCVEHYELHIQTRIDRLSNRINDFRQICHTLTFEQMIEYAQEKLDQWSKNSKNEIDGKHATMSGQLYRELKQINIEQVRARQLKKIDQDIGQPLIDLLQQSRHFQMKDLQILEQRFEELKTINSFVQITDEGRLNLDLIPSISQHSLRHCPGALAGSPLAQNYLLIFQTHPYFSLVFIQDNQHITRTPIDSFVYDICWAQSSQVFLLATEHYLYEFSPINQRLSQPYGNPNSTQFIWSLACNLTDLYVIHKPDMMMYQRDGRKPFEKRNTWLKNDIMCENGDQIVGSIRIDEQKQILGISIKQIDDRWRVDLFSIDTMQRLHRGSSFSLPDELNPSFSKITPLLNLPNQWLAQIYSDKQNQIVLLDENAQVINQIDHHGYNLTLTDRNKIAFLDQIGIQIYQQECLFKLFYLE